MLPSNRDIAAGMLILAVAVALLASRSGRRAVIDMARTLWGKLLILLLAYGGYLVGVAAVAHWLGVWTPKMLGETVAWFFLSGLAVFGKFAKVSRDRWFLRNSLFALIELGAAPVE